MKAISTKQPYASLIANGIKDIENRTWKLPEKYKGQRVLIHASREVKNGENGHITYYGNQMTKGKDYRLIDALTQDQNWYVMENNPELWCDMNERKLPLGAIIGSVELVECVINHPSIWAEKSTSEYYIYNWVLANPILFPEPIPAKGRLGFWDYLDIDSEEDDLTGERICLCSLPVSDKEQVIDLAGEFRCRYCGGKWYK